MTEQSVASESYTEEPTSEYREHNGKRQRLWAITIRINGVPVRGGVDWRDVPDSEGENEFSNG